MESLAELRNTLVSNMASKGGISHTYLLLSTSQI